MIRPLVERTFVQVKTKEGDEKVLLLNLSRAKHCFADRRDGKIFRSTLMRHRREILFKTGTDWVLEQRCVRMWFHVWTPPRYQLITQADAALWLCIQGYERDPSFPKELKGYAAAYSLGI